MATGSFCKNMRLRNKRTRIFRFFSEKNTKGTLRKQYSFDRTVLFQGCLNEKEITGLQSLTQPPRQKKQKVL